MDDEFARWAPAYESQLDTPLARTLGGGSPQTFNRLKCHDLLERLHARGQNPADLTLLDLGCGTGLTEETLAGSFRRLIALDASQAMLKEARQRNLVGIEWLHAQASHVPLPDASVNVALAMGLLHHARPDRHTLLAEARRYLAPGGLLALYEHNPWNPVTRWVVGQCPVDADMEWVYPLTLQKALARAGFKILSTRYLFFFPRSLKPLLPLERFLAWLPAGGQYLVLAQKEA